MFIATGGLAQLGERGLCKPEVRGSIPLTSTMISMTSLRRGLLISEGPAWGSNPDRGAERANAGALSGLLPYRAFPSGFKKRQIR